MFIRDTRGRPTDGDTLGLGYLEGVAEKQGQLLADLQGQIANTTHVSFLEIYL